jgi:hypothetical protein
MRHWLLVIDVRSKPHAHSASVAPKLRPTPPALLVTIGAAAWDLLRVGKSGQVWNWHFHSLRLIIGGLERPHSSSSQRPASFLRCPVDREGSHREDGGRPGYLKFRRERGERPLTRLNLAEFIIGRRFAQTRWLDFATSTTGGEGKKRPAPRTATYAALIR